MAEALGSSIAEMDLDRPNLEEYLPTDSIQDSPKNLHLCCCAKRRKKNEPACLQSATQIECLQTMSMKPSASIIPSFTRRCIANYFGCQACWMLCDARYALCRKLPVIVELTVFSAFPVSSRLRLMPMAMEGLELSQLAAAGSAEDEMCAICLAELHAGSEVTRLPCSHYFHGECVLRWLRINCSCPLCRFVLPH
uniref:RING-type domain-containing protein n=1 Tax=Ananas comosus var. bracteatus TaxID=296719 RepID=A0A6V7NKY9_ANACO|nr:unnamed protein product [Ananas comosus var. bracteatus]